MNARVVWALARKDIGEVLRNKFAWMPVVMVPVVFAVVFPAIILLGVGAGGDAPKAPPKWLAEVIATLPADLARALAGRPADEVVPLLLLGHFFAPLFLMVPMTVATVVGANAFAGEKERKTLEPLLYTPLTDAELFAGKALAAFLPAVVATWATFALYAAVVNAGAWSFMGRIWFPLPAWWPLMLWVAPAIAGLAVGGTVLVSARVGTFIEANQSAGALSLLVVGLMASQGAGVLMVTAPVAFAIGAAVWLVDLGVLWLAVRTFTRAKQIGRL